jgi:hypothetical protein
MSVEAKSLLKLVRERFPAAHAAFEDLAFELRAGGGGLDELVRPLQDPHLAQPVREKIETLIRQRVHDLSALAQVSSLPSTHPLREGAAALVLALQAVTSGPVEEAALLLPQISRRSPLASWKALVHAIASFYRAEDESCSKWLQAIAPDSVPACLIPPMQTMLGAAPAATLSAPAARLLSAVGSGLQLLQSALATLERAMQAGKQKPILEAARTAVNLCRGCSPGMVDKLRKHIAVRCMFLNFHPDTVFAAIGGFPYDAYWYRLLARGLEEYKVDGHYGQALSCWEDFRHFAIRENWFVPNSLEDGVISLHMAQIAEHLSDDEIEAIRRSRRKRPDKFRLNESPSSEDLLSPGKLYERACNADPYPDVFQQWLNWGKKQQDWKIADHLAALWHQALPQDVEPLFWLMESAEKRGAFKKSLNFLEQAEQLDRLNPEVRKFKLKVLTAGIIRFLAQEKTHLAAQAIERMAALPEEQDGNLSPLLCALRLVCSTLNNEMDLADRYRAELEEQLGSAGTYLLHKGLARAARLALQEISLEPARIARTEGASLLKDLSRTCTLANLADVPLIFPDKWIQPLIRALADSGAALNLVQLLGLGEAALLSSLGPLAFAISAQGLARGGADARFLFLRARSLPVMEAERQDYTLVCALELARRERDMDLAGKILDELLSKYKQRSRGSGFINAVGRDNFSMEPEVVNEILEEERKDSKFPAQGERNLPRYARQRQKVEPEWQASSREPAWSDLDLDDDEDVLDALDELIETMPPDAVKEMLKAMERGETAEEFIARKVAEEEAEARGFPPHPRKAPQKRGKLPEQETLF